MNILVTGGSGFIGRHTVDRLVEAGHRVRVLDLKTPHRADVDFINGDITSKEDVARGISNIEVVYHLAAFSNIDLVKDNPVTTVKYNILGTACLLNECRKQDTGRFILASTVYIYDKRGHLYTTCKIASEMLCRDYENLYGLPYTILRYGTAYGPGNRDADVVSIFVRRALEGKSLVIRGSGEQKRHFIYIEDLAEGNLASLTPAAVNQTYALVGPRAVTIKALAETVKQAISKKVPIEFERAREDDHLGELYDINADIITTDKELDWKPKIDLKEGIARYIKWLSK